MSDARKLQIIRIVWAVIMCVVGTLVLVLMFGDDGLKWGLGASVIGIAVNGYRGVFRSDYMSKK